MSDKIDRITDYLRVNEQNVREMYKMVHDLKEELASLKVQTNRIETTIEKIEKHLDL